MLSSSPVCRTDRCESLPGVFFSLYDMILWLRNKVSRTELSSANRVIITNITLNSQFFMPYLSNWETNTNYPELYLAGSLSCIYHWKVESLKSYMLGWDIVQLGNACLNMSKALGSILSNACALKRLIVSWILTLKTNCFWIYDNTINKCCPFWIQYRTLGSLSFVLLGWTKLKLDFWGCSRSFFSHASVIVFWLICLSWWRVFATAPINCSMLEKLVTSVLSL